MGQDDESEGFTSEEELLAQLGDTIDALALGSESNEDNPSEETKTEDNIFTVDATASTNTTHKTKTITRSADNDIPVPIWARVDDLPSKWQGFDDKNSAKHFNPGVTFRFVCFFLFFFLRVLFV